MRHPFPGQGSAGPASNATRRQLLGAAPLVIAAAAGLARPALAQDALKIGFVGPMTGPFAPIGFQTLGAIRLCLAQQNETAGGRRLSLVVRDDAGEPQATRRLTQELVLNERVGVLCGMGLTPQAFAAAPIVTQAKVPAVVMNAATSGVPAASPFYVRSFVAVPAIMGVLAQWAVREGLRNVVTLVSDYGPGIDSETWFKKPFEAAGGRIPASLRVPLANPDFAPFLQRAADAKPDAVMVFVPAGLGTIFMKQFAERGLVAAGVKLIGGGDLTDDDILNSVGETALGVVTAYHYSAAHDSPENRRFVTEFARANGGRRPNFMAVAGFDGATLILKALEKTGGATGQALVDAMGGLSWESPRGPVTIDPRTRDIVHDMYMRRVEKRGDEYWNVEFDRFPQVKDPANPLNGG